MFLTFVRTNAPPLPGFTCWNSTIRQTSPSSWMCMPFLNWFVLTISATGRASVAPGSGDLDQVLREAAQHVDAAVAHDDEVLDAHAALAGRVDAGLDREDVAWLEHVGRLGPRARRLVDEQADAVAEAVAEQALELGCVDRLARQRVRLPAGHPGGDAVDGAGLRRVAHAVRVREP